MIVGIAVVALVVLATCVVVALALARLVHLNRHPRLARGLSLGGIVVAVGTLVVQMAVPVLHRSELSAPNVWPDYFLAMTHFFAPDSPFPFFWMPQWVYQVGTLTPLVAVGGAAAAACGLVAGRDRGRLGLATGALGVGLLAVFVSLATFSARAAWAGVGL